MDFKNKVVIITGAAGGIGAQAVKSFAEKGAKVTLVDISKANLEKTAKDLNLKEGNYLLVPADVAKEEDVKNYVLKTKEVFGKIDIFVNIAGIEGIISKLADYNTDAFNKVMEINVRGTFLGMKYVLNVMKEQKYGSIVNASSCAGLIGMPDLSIYATSKFAISGMTRSAAKENAGLGIRINAICPAFIDTRMMRSIEGGFGGEEKQEETKSDFAKTIPMQRYGSPQEVVDAIEFLASDKASFITGALLPIDGGYVA